MGPRSVQSRTPSHCCLVKEDPKNQTSETTLTIYELDSLGLRRAPSLGLFSIWNSLPGAKCLTRSRYEGTALNLDGKVFLKIGKNGEVLWVKICTVGLLAPGHAVQLWLKGIVWEIYEWKNMFDQNVPGSLSLFYSTPPNILLGGISVGWPLWTWNGWDGSHLSPISEIWFHPPTNIMIKLKMLHFIHIPEIYFHPPNGLQEYQDRM